MVILWTLNAPRLGQKQNLKYRETLKNHTAKSFMTIFSFFKVSILNYFHLNLCNDAANYNCLHNKLSCCFL